MPHSGGGGSHGGGSHGGSHGSHGSSTRTSHTYFPGARRFRRRYRDGRPDEYFYSNRYPQKTGLSGIISILLFGGIFFGIVLFSIKSTAPRKLEEEYSRPSSRIVDEIDILDKEDELEDVLEEFNDVTGICPVIYTICTEDYEDDYVDLEQFSYVLYEDKWADEQHYLLVYAIPEDQVEEYKAGRIDVPDFEFEIMMGDETDPIITESFERSVVDNIQSNLDRGVSPDNTFIGVFDRLTELCEDRLESGKKLSIGSLMPLIFVAVIFILPLIAVIKAYIKDKNTDLDEVPLTESDDEYLSQYKGSHGETRPVSFQSMAANGGPAAPVIKVIMVLFFIPFIAVGLYMVIGGAAGLASGGDPGRVFQLIFGIVWMFILSTMLVTVFKGFGKMNKRNDDGAPMTADYPKAEYPRAEYPQADYPDHDYSSVSHDECRSTHEEDEDSIRKGYE